MGKRTKIGDSGIRFRSILGPFRTDISKELFKVIFNGACVYREIAPIGDEARTQAESTISSGSFPGIPGYTPGTPGPPVTRVYPVPGFDPREVDFGRPGTRRREFVGGLPPPRPSAAFQTTVFLPPPTQFKGDSGGYPV